ncbi:MAG TPA: hypothetical protein VI248_04060, partial [Kineosporiaceae bacterium]
SAVGLAAVVGRVPMSPPVALGPAGPGVGEGTRATGVVLGQQPAGLLVRGLDQACGGLSPPVVLVPNGGVRFDPATHDLAVDVLVDVLPGRVRFLSVGVARTAVGSTLVPRWTSDPVLVPDRTGQARTTLYFRTDAAGPDCPRRPADLPLLAVVLHVAGSGGERVLPHSVALAFATEPSGRTWNCTSSA